MAGVTTNGQVSVEISVGRRPSPRRWPVCPSAVPPLAACFSPRPESGIDVASGPAPGETVVLAAPTPPEAAGRYPLPGTGGTGKTQLAAALARSLWGSGALDLLAWVPAATRDSVITGYAQAQAATAALEGGASGTGDAPEAEADGFLAWLARTGRPWLVILDDLTDLADLDELWPKGPAGGVLVTTRLPAAAVRGPGRMIREVGAFSAREALSYLTAELYPDQRTGALDLVLDLGCLPLALAQASAVIADSGIDCRRYRQHFTSRRQQMAATEAGPRGATVAATWSIALDRADATSPPGLARPAMALIALLDSGGVPGTVLTSRAARAFIGRHAAGPAADESQVRAVLDRLADVGLVTIDPESASRTVVMHSLVQASARQVIPPAMLEQTAAAAADAVLEAWPHRDHEPLVAQALRDGTASLHQVAGELLWTPEAHPVLLRAGQSLGQAGLPSLAISYWRAMAGTSGRILGPDHAGTLLARDRLAAAYDAAGRPRDAISALGQSLAEREQALGRDDPETLAARSRLAQAHLTAGDQDDAIRLYESTVADRERVLGPDHPDTMTTRGDLAAAYRSADRRKDALPAG